VKKIDIIFGPACRALKSRWRMRLRLLSSGQRNDQTPAACSKVLRGEMDL